MVQNTLFTNPKNDARRAPAAVVKELVDVHGMAPRVARNLPIRAAFARLYAFRRKAMAHTGESLRATARELADDLRARAGDEAATADDLTELAIAALAVLDAGHLRRVAAGLANLCGELSA